MGTDGEGTQMQTTEEKDRCTTLKIESINDEYVPEIGVLRSLVWNNKVYYS